MHSFVAEYSMDWIILGHAARGTTRSTKKKPDTNPARPDETRARASPARCSGRAWADPQARGPARPGTRNGGRPDSGPRQPAPPNGYPPPPAQRPFWPIISPHSAPPFIYKGHAAAAGRPISSPNPNRLIHSTPPAAQRPHRSRLRLTFAAPLSPRRPTSSTPVTLICLPPPASLSLLLPDLLPLPLSLPLLVICEFVFLSVSPLLRRSPSLLTVCHLLCGGRRLLRHRAPVA